MNEFKASLGYIVPGQLGTQCETLFKQIGGTTKERKGEKALCKIEVPDGIHGTLMPHESLLSASNHPYKSYSVLPYPPHHGLMPLKQID